MDDRVPGDRHRSSRARSLRLAFVATYPPTPCGIATFTESLRGAMLGAASSPSGEHRVTADVIRLVEQRSPALPPGVVTEWVRGDPRSRSRAIAIASGYDCIVLQHEFGIFGGPDGDDAVTFVESVSAPVIAVLHTVVPTPTSNQKAIIERICSATAWTIVQTDSAKERLLAHHRIDAAKVRVIPHGAHANFPDPNQPPREGPPVILTWGLLGPGKGIEHMIRALASLASTSAPTPTYVVAGSTHPNVVAREGEAYRSGLKALAEKLGIGDQVVFDDSYRDWDSLRAMVREADIVVLPYDSRDQVTSGVLVEALASAMPIVATDFPHAREALSGGAGIVVPHEDPAALAAALERLLMDPQRQARMRTAARIEASGLLWPQVGQEYLTLATTTARNPTPP